jgi:Acyl-coenzyme A:6-aminopenicillanic acid acyl-transferase
VWGTLVHDKVLIGKNRDFYPGNQKFRTAGEDTKYKFFGLYGDNQFDGKYTIKMGVNQTGLVVFMTFASTIPKNQRTAKIHYYTVMENILGNYDSVDAVYKNSQSLFQNSTPINYIFADRKQAMICEIGLKNNYKCTFYKKRDGRKVLFAQTNHYILPGMELYNLTPVINQQTSYDRFNKINELMQKNVSDLTFKKFVALSFNTEAVNDNPLAKFDTGYKNTYQDNSIFRTFNSHPDRRNTKQPNSDQDVSTMIVELPDNPNDPVNLYLRIINKITDLSDPVFTQKIDYVEGFTTLDKAINHPNMIRYTNKSCQRTIHSTRCE